MQFRNLLKIFIAFLLSITSLSTYGLSPNCNPEEISFDLNDPSSLCNSEPNQLKFSRYVQECVNREDESIVLRREQLKLIFNTEMFYLSRIPQWNKNYESYWKQAQIRWEKRLANSPDLMSFDKRQSLGQDRCFLHQILGLACDPLLDINLLKISKLQAVKELEARAERRKLPISITYDLIEMVLLLQTLPEESESKSLNNFVYSIAPELKVKDTLRNLLNQLTEKLQLTKDITKQIDQLKMNQNSPTLEEVNNLILKTLQNTLSNQAQYRSIRFFEGQIEFIFFRGFNEILKNLDTQIEKAQSDNEWLMRQDYLIVNAMRLAGQLHKVKVVRNYQALLCESHRLNEVRENQLTTFRVVGGFIALFTGAGLFLDLSAGVSFTFLLTSLGLTNAISVVDLYIAFQKYKNEKLLFGLQGLEPSTLTSAEKDFLNTLPWTVINIALTAPLVIINELKIALKVALNANDIARVQKIKATIKIVLAFTFAGNIPVTASMDKQAYEILKAEWETYKVEKN